MMGDTALSSGVRPGGGKDIGKIRMSAANFFKIK